MQKILKLIGTRVRDPITDTLSIDADIILYFFTYRLNVCVVLVIYYCLIFLFDEKNWWILKLRFLCINSSISKIYLGIYY